MKLRKWTEQDLRDDEHNERMAKGEENALALMNLCTALTLGGLVEVVK